MKQALWLLIGGLALAILSVLAQRLQAPDTARLSECDLQQGVCRADLGQGRKVELSITPRPLLPARPLQIEASVEGMVARQVEIEFSGVDMSMGLNQVALAAASPGRFLGQGSLPACTTGRMLWQANLRIVATDTTQTLAFRFYSPP